MFIGDPVSLTLSEERELAEDNAFLTIGGIRNDPISIDSDNKSA